MIVLTFSIENPYFSGWRDFKNIRNWSGPTLFKNKFWEFELMKTGCIIEFDFTVRVRCDHAGATLGMGVFGYSFNATIYDDRHWDHTTNTWKEYNV